MKIAVILGAFSIGTRALDFHFNNIWSSARGLTGTDLTTVVISKELAKRGHDVSLFTVHAEPGNKPSSWEGVKLYNIDQRFIVDATYDCILSINEPAVLIGMTDKPVRIVWQFLNDFTYMPPESNFDKYVDQYLGVCQQHTDHLKVQTASPHKWDTLALGCYPDRYEDRRVPGRIIWCSSADRGLHWLLSCFPKIKEAVPEAHLKVFYHFNYGDLDKIEPDSKTDHSHVIEMGQRIRYMRHAMEKLKPLGVEHIGSVSRIEMEKQFSEASVFGFSCDTVAFSEGFSVSTLESHASFTVPVITDKDCLGSIYQDSGSVMIKGSMKNNLQNYTDAVIKALTDKEHADSVIMKCREFAKQHDWKLITEKLESIIQKNSKFNKWQP